MANTYVNIASQTLSSTAASVTFSSIPATYTDLVLRASVRGTSAFSLGSFRLEQINGTTTSIYSYTMVYGNSSTTVSGNAPNDTMVLSDDATTSTSTASTFGSYEVYIPNYLVASNKPISSVGGLNNPAIPNYRTRINAGLWRSTAAITSFVLTTTSNFEIGSTFYLYGIKNS